MIHSLENIPIVNSIQEKGIFTADLYENSIIEVYWNSELKVVKKEHLMRLTEVIKELGEGKKMRIYFSTYDFMDFDEESRDYSTTAEAAEFSLATAILIDSLGKKILYNFYLKFHKPILPMRAFSSREHAIDWLLTCKD